MRILWFSNVPITDQDFIGTGSWINSMAHALNNSGKVQLGIISESAGKELVINNINNIQQWLIPCKFSAVNSGFLKQSTINQIVKICDEFSPNLVHVWGIEGSWGLLTARKILKFPVLLEIQGLKLSIVDVYYGSLTFFERLQCIGLKEILKRESLKIEKNRFLKWANREVEIIKSHQFIEFQSPWVASHIHALNSNAILFKTERTLRSEFENSSPWSYKEDLILFTSAAYSAPFKGLHIAIKAIAILKIKFPNVKLKIAGPHQKSNLRQDGYIRWINRLILKLGIKSNIIWLGNLPANLIVDEIKSAKAVLIPSFVESYCVAMAESMLIGVPIVSSFTGGTSYLGKDEFSCLFFAPGDYKMCAFQVNRLFDNKDLCIKLSVNSRNIASQRHNPKVLLENQINTYNKILELQ